MPINGVFLLNNKKMSTLSLDGVGVFEAFSGDGDLANHSESTGILHGAIPLGKYFIVKRPTRGALGVISDFRNCLSWPTSNPVIKGEWFALYRDDEEIDDYTWVEGVKHGNFRLHPPGPNRISWGCITLNNRSDFILIRQNITMTNTEMLPNGLVSYGSIKVILDGM